MSGDACPSRRKPLLPRRNTKLYHASSTLIDNLGKLIREPETMSVAVATSQLEFDNSLGSRTCVFFWATWHEPSKPGGQMDQVVNQLAEFHRDRVTFVKVEAEAVPEVSEKLEVAMVPTCVLLKGNVVCGRIEGADPPELSKRVQKLAHDNATEKDETGLPAPRQGLIPELRVKLSKLVSASPLMLFMKGNSQHPKCKFSRKMVELLKGAGIEFGSFDILTDEEIRAGLKILSDCPTYPQLYVKGVLVGGVDDVVKLAESGDLKAQLSTVGEYGGKRQMAPAAGAGSKSVRDRCKELIVSTNTMLFMKGSPEAPQCGFSRTLVRILKEEGIQFKSFDILADPEVRRELKDLSNWPTYPQLYVRGELVGGLDIVQEMKAEGPLASQLQLTTKESVEDRLKGLISSSKVMLFMKGVPDEPQCGFSRTAIQLLRDEGVEFGTFDILEDDEVRQGLKKLSDWPTYPQLYANGELIGGLDIMKEMAQAGELAAALRHEA